MKILHHYTQSGFGFKAGLVSVLTGMTALWGAPNAAAQTGADVYQEKGRSIRYETIGQTTIRTVTDDTGNSPDRVWRYERDEQSRPVLVDGPQHGPSDTTHIEWLDNGKQMRITNALGHQTKYTYNENYAPLSFVTANGVETRFEYDKGWPVKVVIAAGTEISRIYRVSYDETGGITSFQLPNGRVIDDVIDGDGNYTRPARAVLKTIQAQLNTDRYSELFGTKFGSGGRHLPKLLAQFNPNGEQIIENNQITAYEDAGGGMTHYAYDEHGNINKVTDARGVVTRFAYNGFGEIVREISAERGTTNYQYDSAGNVIKETRADGLKIVRKFDVLNRVTKQVYKQNGVDKKTNRFVYDDCTMGIGRLCKLNSTNTTTRFAYNELGKHVRVTTKYDDAEHAEKTRYTYGDYGRLEVLRYPTGLNVRYHYNDSGSVVKVTGRYDSGEDKTRFVIAKNIQIDPNSQSLTQLTYGNGLKTKLFYNEKAKLREISTHRKGQVTDRSTYQYDDQNQITTIDTLEPSQSQFYTYDSVGRLGFEQKADASNAISYAYDAVGNRTQWGRGDKSKSYEYAAGSNRLKRINSQTLSYDGRGNLLKDRNGKRSFGYDVTNRLTQFYKNDVLRARYDYNAFGQRVRKTIYHNANESTNDNTQTLHFAYTPQGWLLSENGKNANRNNTFVREYIWLGNRPLAQLERKIKPNGTTRKAKISYLHVDHLNTPRKASDENGNIVWEWQSDAFGAGKPNKDVDGDSQKTNIRLRFAGQYADAESGLFYNNQRDYDPKLGRYIQSDPIGLHGGINRYGYVGGNPVGFVDPSGLIAVVTTCTDPIDIYNGVGCGQIDGGGGGGGGSGSGYNPGAGQERGDDRYGDGRYEDGGGGSGGGTSNTVPPDNGNTDLPKCPGFIDGLIQGATAQYQLAQLTKGIKNNDPKAIFIATSISVALQYAIDNPAIAFEYGLGRIYENKAVFLGRVGGVSLVNFAGAKGAGFLYGKIGAPLIAQRIGVASFVITNAATSAFGYSAATIGDLYDRANSIQGNVDNLKVSEIIDATLTAIIGGAIAYDPETGAITTRLCK